MGKLNLSKMYNKSLSKKALDKKELRKISGGRQLAICISCDCTESGALGTTAKGNHVPTV